MQLSAKTPLGKATLADSAAERAEEPAHSGMGMTAAAGLVGLLGGACFLLLRRA